MNNFKTVIGIEVHTVINSKSKMFTGTKSCHTDPVNSNISEIDIALPGTLPSVNEEVVRKAICLATALHMDIDKHMTFDRKNYFYRDLPRGFQITQQFHPIGTNGYIEITLEDGSKKKINIERIHMEEDTAKQNKVGDRILLDYNRCGMPLIEIVSKPDISSAYEAMQYLTELKRILNFSGEISDAKMEEGSLRADVNISINPYGTDKYGTRVEIKNINSITNVGKAIEFEEKRQAGLYLSGQMVTQDTRRYDDGKGQTIYMRAKSTGVDYHFMPEPNILPFELEDDFIKESLKQLKYVVPEVKSKLQNLGLDDKIVTQLLDDYQLFKVFDKVLSEVKDVTLVITWILVELIGLLKKDIKTIETVPSIKIDRIIRMIKLLTAGKINSKQAKTIIAEIYNTDAEPEAIIEKFGFKQITDKAELANYINNIVAKNPKMVEQYKERPERVEKMFLGLLMKETKGQANPVIATEVLREILKK